MSSKRTVVVVDDNPHALGYLCELVEEAGGVVIAQANTFDEGLAALKKHRPDLLLTDYVLDRLHSGTELIREGKPAVAIVVSSEMSHLTKKGIGGCGENTAALAKEDRAGILAAIRERLGPE